MDYQIFCEKLREKFSDENYSVIYQGKHSKENSVFRCLDCGRRIEVNTGELFRTRRKHLCAKCHYKRLDTIANEKLVLERLAAKAKNVSFFMQDHNGIRHNMVSFTCSSCGRANTKNVANFLRQLYDCSYCEGKKESKDTDCFVSQLREKFGEKFTLLNEYTNAATNVRIRCNECGFIRDIKPGALLASGYCPKCSDKSSRGERVIMNFLNKRGLTYETQKYFSEWDIGIHYFDFYIPEFNLVLEYHGKQHYEFNPFFHKDQANFLFRAEKDKAKKNAAIDRGMNYVSIHYSLFSNLPSILEQIFNSTTIPKGSRGKCLEIETAQDLGEDIVYSPLKDGVEK